MKVNSIRLFTPFNRTIQGSKNSQSAIPTGSNKLARALHEVPRAKSFN